MLFMPDCGWLAWFATPRSTRRSDAGTAINRCAPDGNLHFYSSKVIDRALAMYAEGASAAAIGRAMEINEAAVLRRVKKALSSKRIMDAERSERKPASADTPASVRKIRGVNSDKPQVKTISFDEMWTYLGVRRGKKRQSAWIWTAVEEWDGSRRADFRVGYRDAETFRRLPKAARHGSDHYKAYSLLTSVRHVKGKGSE